MQLELNDHSLPRYCFNVLDATSKFLNFLKTLFLIYTQLSIRAIRLGKESKEKRTNLWQSNKSQIDAKQVNKNTI